MSYISQSTGYIFLVIFGICMVLTTYFFAKWKRWRTKEGFLVADRKLNWFLGGTSIAASWIWAPALFISSQVAYEQGLAGVFWFTFPNILALAIFGLLAPKIKKRFRDGYTLPQYIRKRLRSRKVHKIYLFAYGYYQIMAVTVQLFAGGSLMSLLTGIHLIVIMPVLAVIALAYTLISGLEASVITDFVQMGMIVLVGAFVILLTFTNTGDMITASTVAGLETRSGGIGGLLRDMFDPGVAFSFGIVSSIGLIAGAVSDQQYWQRTFAIRRKHLKKAFIFGALLFGIIPIALSSLGFFASSAGITVPEGIDNSMIGVQTVATILPGWAVFLFVVMLLGGLSSTLDSGLSAASSLWVTDIAKPGSDRAAVNSARLSMVGATLVGLVLAIAITYIPNFGLMQLWWIINTIGACILIPTILSLYWRRLSAKGVFIGSLTAFVIGLPLFIYGNIISSAGMTVSAALFILVVSAVFCLVFKKKGEVAQFQCHVNR